MVGPNSFSFLKKRFRPPSPNLSVTAGLTAVTSLGLHNVVILNVRRIIKTYLSSYTNTDKTGLRCTDAPAVALPGLK